MRILFIHDPGVHKAHAAWAESVGARFVNCNPSKSPAIMRPLQAFVQARTIGEYDAILAEGGTCLPLAARIKKKSGAKLIVISADALFYDFNNQNAVRKKYMSNLLANVDGAIAVSSLAKSCAEKYLDAPISIVHPYADIEKFSGIKPKLDGRKIIFIGKHRHDKNIEGLAEEFRKIRKSVPGAELVLIGGLIPERMPSAKLADGVTVTGSLKFEEMKKHIEDARIFMHIAYFDPCPVVVAEVMAAGLPPLISEGVGSRDFVPKQLVAREDYAEHAIKLLEMPQRRIENLSDKCRKIAKRHTKERSQATFRKAFFNMIK